MWMLMAPKAESLDLLCSDRSFSMSGKNCIIQDTQIPKGAEIVFKNMDPEVNLIFFNDCPTPIIPPLLFVNYSQINELRLQGCGLKQLLPCIV